MSVQEVSPEVLPEDPTVSVIGTISNENTIVQTVNDTTIASLAGASKLEAANSVTSAALANEHMVAQTNEEGMASFSADEQDFKQHDSAAQTHNVLSHSASSHADEAGAKSVALDRVANVQIAVAEVETRKVVGAVEIENRTVAGVEAEMKATGAVLEEDARKSAGAAQDLESELAISAEVTADAPKMG